MKPANLLIYYGWPNSFNSATNAWTNEKVAQEMAMYDLIVLGAGLQDPGHGDYANTQIIIPRIKALNPASLVYGYVTILETIGNFQTKAGQWNTLGVHGIFMDEAGYDYGSNRDNFNTRVDYVHGQTTAKKCFVNAWNMDHIIGTVDDPSFPNATYNSLAHASTLNNGDWYLLESFSVNTTSYTGNNGYTSKSDWSSRGDKAVQRRATYGIKLAAVGIIDNNEASAMALFNFSYRSALAYELDAHGTSDTNYGASSAAVTWWNRPQPRGIPQSGGIPSVLVDAGNSNIYMRYANFSKIIINHMTAAQTSSIVQW
jgi:hypothetical protein